MVVNDVERTSQVDGLLVKLLVIRQVLVAPACVAGSKNWNDAMMAAGVATEPTETTISFDAAL